jgi:DNA-directed RNA polymerase specialized sigma24 family protein
VTHKFQDIDAPPQADLERGDKNAWLRLVLAASGLVRGVASREWQSASPTDLDDIVQDVLLRVYATITKKTEIRQMRAFLAFVAKNEAIRRRGRHPRTNSSTAAPELAVDARDPERIAAAAEEIALLNVALERCTPWQRKLYEVAVTLDVLERSDGEKADVICRAMGWHPQVTRVQEQLKDLRATVARGGSLTEEQEALQDLAVELGLRAEEAVSESNAERICSQLGWTPKQCLLETKLSQLRKALRANLLAVISGEGKPRP